MATHAYVGQLNSSSPLSYTATHVEYYGTPAHVLPALVHTFSTSHNADPRHLTNLLLEHNWIAIERATLSSPSTSKPFLYTEKDKPRNIEWGYFIHIPTCEIHVYKRHWGTWLHRASVPLNLPYDYENIEKEWACALKDGKIPTPRILPRNPNHFRGWINPETANAHRIIHQDPNLAHLLKQLQFQVDTAHKTLYEAGQQLSQATLLDVPCIDWHQIINEACDGLALTQS